MGPDYAGPLPEGYDTIARLPGISAISNMDVISSRLLIIFPEITQNIKFQESLQP